MESVTKNSYECIVIGAGPAGSTAAYYLAKFGYKVAVIEKSESAHQKVCGEFLSFEAMSYLKEIGVTLSEDSPVVKYFQLHSPHSKASFTFPFAGRGVSRFKLDEDLLNNASDNGAHVIRGVCMRGYLKESDGSFKIETNKGYFYARHLFMAIGKHDHSKEHKRVGKDNLYIGFKTHIKLNALDRVYKETTVLFTFPGGYGGICPVENDVMNFCFVIEKAVYKNLHSDFNELITFLRQSNSQLDSILKEASFIEPVCALGYIPYGYLSTAQAQEDVYFLGDQRMVIPSFTGDGMAIALSTAKDCAYEFNRRQKGLKVHNQLLQKILKQQMHWALLGHAILKSPWALEVCALIPGIKSFLIETIFNKTRISKVESGWYAL